MSNNFRIKPCNPTYPYLIVRLAGSFYQHVDIHLHKPAEEYLGFGLEVVCDETFTEDGSLSASARNRLLEKVQSLVAQERLRMCIVLGARQALYVELDGSVKENNEPPWVNSWDTDLEIYDRGRMPTRKALEGRLHEYEYITHFLFTAPSDELEKHYFVSYSAGDDGELWYPITSFADLWQVLIDPYWLLCLYRWLVLEPGSKGVHGYANWCGEQIGSLCEEEERRFFAALQSGSWLRVLWLLTELYEQRHRQANGKDKAAHEAWQRTVSQHLKDFLPLPPYKTGDPRIPLDFERIVRYILWGLPVMSDHGVITVDDRGPLYGLLS